MKYKIYKLIYKNEVIYIGQTTTSLKRRKWAGYRGTVVQDVIEHCEMVLIEETDDVSKERYWIDFYKDSVWNKLKGDTGLDLQTAKKKWSSENKDKVNETAGINREKNRDKINSRRRERRRLLNQQKLKD